MFKKILVPIDLDYADAAAAVYRKAALLAGTNGAEIRLVSVMPGFGMPIVSSFISDDIRQEAADRFRKLMERFIQENCRASVTYCIAVGKNWEEIIQEADNWGADLIIVYHNRRHDINEVFSRSCTQRVTDNAGCSVLRLRKIMVQ
jgi:nucleotide-binding universal stress UspA family protein